MPPASFFPNAVSGPKAALDEATAVLRQIDRPARVVHMEVLCLELAARGDEKGADAKPLDRAELSGTDRDVRAKLRELQQKGLIAGVKTVELTGLAGQSSRTQVTESRPYVTGVSSFGGFGGRGGAGGAAGTTSRSITYRDVGVSVQVRPEVAADGQLTLDLHVEDARMRAAEGGVSLGSDDKGTGVPATEFVVATLESRVKVRPGHLVVAESTTAGSKAGQAQTVILVGASTDEAGPKDGK